MPTQDGELSKHEEIDLTPEDETALDKAMDAITDADIAASILWLKQQKEDTHGRQPQ